MKKLNQIFFKGLIVVLPITLTFYLLYWASVNVESIFAPILARLIGDWLYVTGLGILFSLIFIMLILQVLATAQVFLEPFLFTSGGPNNATVTVLLLIYRYAFQNSLGGDYGEATALSLLLAIALALLSFAYFRATKRWSTS